MNLLLLCLNSSILLCTGPQKCDRSARLKVKICSTIERNIQNSLHHWTFHSKKVLQSSFYDNRNLKISKKQEISRNKVNTEIDAAKELFYNNKFTETNATRVKRGKLSTILRLVRPLIYRLEK